MEPVLCYLKMYFLPKFPPLTLRLYIIKASWHFAIILHMLFNGGFYINKQVIFFAIHYSFHNSLHRPNCRSIKGGNSNIYFALRVFVVCFPFGTVRVLDDNFSCVGSNGKYLTPKATRKKASLFGLPVYELLIQKAFNMSKTFYRVVKRFAKCLESSYKEI